MQLSTKTVQGIIASLAISPLMATSAFATTSYTFDRHVGDVWVGDVEVTSSNGYTSVELYMAMPTCGSATQLKGSVDISYYSNNGGYLTNYSIHPYEGDSGWYEVGDSVSMSESGRVRIVDNLYCGHLDINPNPGTWDLNDIDLNPGNWF